MSLKKLSNKVSDREFRELALYFGIAVRSQLSDALIHPNSRFVDIEVFFLSSTYSLKTSRIAEGFLCWLLKFGHLLSPSKVRRLIHAGHAYDPAVLGGLIELMIERKILPQQWKIVQPFCRKWKQAGPLVDGPLPRNPLSYFLKYRVLAPQFQLDGLKFLLPTNIIFRNCIELRNRGERRTNRAKN